MSDRQPSSFANFPERSVHGALLWSYGPVSRRLATVLLLCLLGLTGLSPAIAQEGGDTAGRDGRGVLAYTMRHQSVNDALILIRPQLSPIGTFELQPGGNTLVVRDQRAVIDRLKPILTRFDQPPRALRLDIHLLRAGNKAGTPLDAKTEAVVARVRQHLAYKSYELLGQAGLSAREGEPVTYTLGNGYNVNFTLGRLLTEQRLKLHGFRITRDRRLPAGLAANKSRQPEPRELINTQLNLWRDKPYTLVLSQTSGASQALMVAITFRPDEGATP